MQELQGIAANPGQAEGTVVVAAPDEIPEDVADKILVTQYTTPLMTTAIMQCAAIVTDSGGRTSHAAVIARELGKPCVVNTGNATEVLQNGDTVRVQGDEGVVTYE